jgi:hypothetical protein
MQLDRALSARARRRTRVSLVDRLDYFLRSRASKVVVLALVANTMVAQLLYNSAGQLVLGTAFVVGYLLVSAVCSTCAFALFEVSTIFQLHDLMALDTSIKDEIGAQRLIRRGYVVLAVSSLINFLSVLYFLALAWHSAGGQAARFPLDDLPLPWNWCYYALHAGAYTAVLFLAGIFGERPKSGKEVILATQRALEQQALERWRMQKEAQIEAMMREGVPLGAVAAALASPATAERIAVLEAATSGGMSALEAARLTVQRAGHDLSLLEGLRRIGVPPVSTPSTPSTLARASSLSAGTAPGVPGASADVEDLAAGADVAEGLLRPFGLGHNGAATRARATLECSR